MNDLNLTADELRTIVAYAQTARSDDTDTADPQTLALALEIVALCMLRLTVGDPPMSGPEVDQWYDVTFGQNMRVAAAKLDPAVQKLRDAGIIPNA